MAANTFPESLELNYFNTTTQAVLGSNTALSSYLFNRDLTFQYITSGFNNDATTASIVISFDQTTTIDRIALLGHNLKGYTVFYNGATANVFALTSTSATTTANFSSNSEPSQYFRVTPVACTSVTLDLKTTQTTNAEKAIGYLYLGALNLSFERIPSSKNYHPVLDQTQIIHKLSDGGTRVQNIAEKIKIDFKYQNITSTFRDNLKDLYRRSDAFFFCPFGTTTSFDELFFECVWEGPFDFMAYSDDAVSSGFGGTIRLRETAL